jgi:hypothetical protein
MRWRRGPVFDRLRYRRQDGAVSGDVVFRHACKMGLEGIVSKRLGSRYRSGRSPDWLKMKNPAAPAVKREKKRSGANDRTHSLPRGAGAKNRPPKGKGRPRLGS